MENAMPTQVEARIFANRGEAGRALGHRLLALQLDDVVVLGLTRGGVPVAVEVARTLQAPLDVIIVNRLGTPPRSQGVIGAVGENGARYIDDSAVMNALIGPNDVEVIEQRGRMATDRQANLLREIAAPLMLGGRTALIVDDGLAVGFRARVACQVARHRGADRIVVAVPVASPEGLRVVGEDVDQTVALQVPDDFVTVGRSYLAFTETSDQDVGALLQSTARAQTNPGARQLTRDLIAARIPMKCPGRVPRPRLSCRSPSDRGVVGCGRSMRHLHDHGALAAGAGGERPNQ
jgi:putative phosphoribosyl transferase